MSDMTMTMNDLSMAMPMAKDQDLARLLVRYIVHVPR